MTMADLNNKIKSPLPSHWRTILANLNYNIDDTTVLFCKEINFLLINHETILLATERMLTEL